MCSWKSPNSTESKTFFLSSSPHNAGAPGCQVYKGWQCTVAVKCEFSARRCTDAQIFLSIHQEKGNYDVEAGDPHSPIFWQQPNFGPRAHTALLHSRYHIPLRQDTVVAHFLYKRRAEPIKQLHVPRQQQERLCCQTGNGNQISTISTPRYAVILPSWPPCLSVINRY